MHVKEINIWVNQNRREKHGKEQQHDLCQCRFRAIHPIHPLENVQKLERPSVLNIPYLADQGQVKSTFTTLRTSIFGGTRAIQKPKNVGWGAGFPFDLLL